jgi:hypothetical protein
MGMRTRSTGCSKLDTGNPENEGWGDSPWFREDVFRGLNITKMIPTTTGGNTDPPMASSPDSAPRRAEDLALVQGVLKGNRLARRRFAKRMECVPRYLMVANTRMGKPPAQRRPRGPGTGHRDGDLAKA